jgi:hypothetical protein
MKKQATYLTLVFVLLCRFASAQSVDPSFREDHPVARRPTVGAPLPVETLHQFLRGSSKAGTPADLKPGIDSLGIKTSSFPFQIDGFPPNKLQRGFAPVRVNGSPQSRIYIIDTAIVRSTIDTTRHLYSFNATARRTYDVTQKLVGNIWVDTLSETSAYDASDSMLSDLFEQWSNGQWVGWSRYTYTYGANGKMLSEVNERTWLTQQWKNFWRYTYTYDAHGNTLSQLFENCPNDQWANSSRDTWAYDATGNALTDLRESWSNGQWVADNRFTFTYNTNGNMLSRLYETWSNGQWVGVYRDMFTFEENGSVRSYLEDSWSNAQWVDIYRGTYTYDGNGNVLSFLEQSCSNNLWVDFERDTYSYDANGRDTSCLVELWSNPQWVNYERYAYSYDVNGNLTSVWHDGWFASSWQPVSMFPVDVYDSAGNYYEYWGYNITLIRKLIATGIASQNGTVPATYSLSQNYPNPFNPSTTITYELPRASQVNLTVFDILGREVSVLVNDRKDAGVYEEKFDGSRLASGVYFYRLQTGDFVQTKRLMILK